jgi:hypothetical protein
MSYYNFRRSVVRYLVKKHGWTHNEADDWTLKHKEYIKKKWNNYTPTLEVAYDIATGRRDDGN